jgi:hypothetical protein
MPSFVLGAKIPGTNKKSDQGQMSDSLVVTDGVFIDPMEPELHRNTDHMPQPHLT